MAKNVLDQDQVCLVRWMLVCELVFFSYFFHYETLDLWARPDKKETQRERKRQTWKCTRQTNCKKIPANAYIHMHTYIHMWKFTIIAKLIVSIVVVYFDKTLYLSQTQMHFRKLVEISTYFVNLWIYMCIKIQAKTTSHLPFCL